MASPGSCGGRSMLRPTVVRGTPRLSLDRSFRCALEMGCVTFIANEKLYCVIEGGAGGSPHPLTVAS